MVAVGERTEGTFTGRTSLATAYLIGQQATVFPSHYGGFLGGEFGYAGQPEAFAPKLRTVLTRHKRRTPDRARRGPLSGPRRALAGPPRPRRTQAMTNVINRSRSG